MYKYGKHKPVVDISPRATEQRMQKYLAKILPMLDGRFPILGAGGASLTPEQLKNLEEVIIFDTTGRDGMQQSEAFVNLYMSRMKSKKRVIEMLAEWGIPVIEVGYPASSEEEFNTCKSIAETIHNKGISTGLVGLTGTIREHIMAVRDAGLDQVHVFSSGSPEHTLIKFGKRPEEVIKDVVDSVKYAVKLGFRKILVSLEDSFRADPDHLVEVAKQVKDAARDRAIRFNVPDTIGIAYPTQAYGLIAYIKQAIPFMPLDVHFHNDGGLAAINSFLAVLAGASRVHTTMNGLGERGGNTPFHQFILHLYQHGIIPKDVYGNKLQLKELYKMAKFVEECSGIPISPNEILIGLRAFTHESGIHANGFLKSIDDGLGFSIYAPIDPGVFGREETTELGPLAGKSNHIIMLEKLGINPKRIPPEKLDAIVQKNKEESSLRHISTAEYVLDVYSILENEPYKRLTVDGTVHTPLTSTGGRQSKSQVTIQIGAKIISVTDCGNGPIDAVVKAINTAIQEMEGESAPKIINYAEKGVGTGSEQSAEVTLLVKNGVSDRSIESICYGKNIVAIAIEAYVQAYNALHALEILKRKYGTRIPQTQKQI